MQIKIRTPDGNTMEWTVRQGAKQFVVKQVDKAGTLRIEFPTADLAGGWVLTNVDYFRSAMKAEIVID